MRKVSTDEKRRIRYARDWLTGHLAVHINGLPNGEMLRKLRELSGWSRQGLGALLGLSYETIARYERTGKCPDWYLLLLRFLAGDLSAYGPPFAGNCWVDVRDRKLCAVLVDGGRVMRGAPGLIAGFMNEQVRHYYLEASQAKRECQALRDENKAIREQMAKAVRDLGPNVVAFTRPRRRREFSAV